MEVTRPLLLGPLVKWPVNLNILAATAVYLSVVQQQLIFCGLVAAEGQQNNVLNHSIYINAGQPDILVPLERTNKGFKSVNVPAL